jgi:tetratricopeptide (TPR) repeat protein
MKFDYLVCSLLFFFFVGKSQNLKQLKEDLDGAVKENKSNVALEKKIQIGEIYAENGLYANALEYFNEVLKTYQKKTKDSLFVKVSIEVGELYNNTKRYNSAIPFIEHAIHVKALEFENKSLTILNTNDDKTIRAKVYENIGSIYEDLM